MKNNELVAALFAGSMGQVGVGGPRPNSYTDAKDRSPQAVKARKERKHRKKLAKKSKRKNRRK